MLTLPASAPAATRTQATDVPSWSSPANRTAGVGTGVPTLRTVTEHAARLGTETRNSIVPPAGALGVEA